LWPQEQALRAVDPKVVDAGMTMHHENVCIEFPVFIAVCTKPLAGRIVPFISEADRDAVACTNSQFFDQPVIKFALPFALQELAYLVASARKIGPVSLDCVRCIDEHDAVRIARISSVFGHAHFLSRCFWREGQNRRFGFHRRFPVLAIVCQRLSLLAPEAFTSAFGNDLDNIDVT
jgi:hypothetical protein